MRKFINNKLIKVAVVATINLSIIALPILSSVSYAYTKSANTPEDRNKTEAELNSYSEEEWSKLKDNTIEYIEIRDLIHNFNPNIASAWDNYNSNITDLKKSVDALNSSRKILKDLANTENDAQVKNLYLAQEAGLYNAVKGMNKTIQNLDRSVSKNNAPLRIAEDNLVFATKNIMLNYKSIESRESILKELVELNEASVSANEALKNQGMITETALNKSKADLIEARANLLRLSSTREQIYKTLIVMCGYKENEDIVIGEIPEPDIEFIDKINIGEDIKKAIGNNYNLVELRHEKYKVSLASKEARNLKESQMEANLRTNITKTFTELQAEKSNYLASIDGFEAAKINYGAVKKQYELGMISKVQYKGMSMPYIQSKSEYDSSKLNLMMKIETYKNDIAGAALTE